MFRLSREKGRSHVAGRRAIAAYQARPDARYLVSFPRTGSHWLRMICEAYTDRPTLVRSFYDHDNEDYLFLHVHDVELDFVAQDIIYLYRDPLPTVYSTMKYHRVEGEAEVRKWAGAYRAHLDKWLLQDQFSRSKTLVRYEDLPAGFERVAAHLGLDYDPARLAHVAEQITLEHVREHTAHDPQVMRRDQVYALQGDEFAERYWRLVDDCVFEQSPGLRPFFG
jgi:hypothetical protein